MTITYLIVGLVVLGVLGLGLERIGSALEKPRLVAVGAAIKSLASDLPGFVTNLVEATKAKKA